MRYDSRVILINYETVNGPLGQTTTPIETVRACAKQDLSFEENVTVFGEAKKDSLKLHFPSHTKGYKDAIFDGQTYNIYLERHFRRHTVLYLSGDGR